MKKILSFLMIFVFAATVLNAQYNVLLVDDDDNTPEADPIVTALTNWGGTYATHTTSASGVPDSITMSTYDMVIWYTGNDGITNLWDVSDTLGVGAGAAKFNNAVQGFVENGGVLWIDGLDFIYDLYGSAPDDFAAGDFVYDKLGITQYLSQSHVDDGTFSDGVQQLDKSISNTITTLDPITWSYSTLWYCDGYAINANATALYEMGPTGYDLADQISAFYYNNIIASTIRIAKLGDGTNIVQAKIDLLVSEMIAAAQSGNFSAAVNEISKLNINIYPNPAKESASINISEINNASNIAVYDITGRIVYSKAISGQKHITINTSDYASGIYNVIINSGNETYTTKLSVVK